MEVSAMKASERYRRYEERDEEEKRERWAPTGFGGSYLATGVFLAIVIPFGFTLRGIELNATTIAWVVGVTALAFFITWLSKCLER